MAEETMTDDNNDRRSYDREVTRQDFPNNFLFGVGTSAHQVEGAWNADGKGFNIWDCFTLRNPDKFGGANACVTVDSYARMKEDVQLLKKLGVNSFRFSLSWARILPGGKVSMGKNMEGINYYNKLIDELLRNGIEPFVTIFHWDLPNALEEEYMGFLSSNIVDDFVNYADICFWEFGDRVKNWATLNEPYRFTYSGYVEGRFPPGRGEKNEDSDVEREPYIVAYNLLCCHAAAYRKYEKDYKSFQKGKVGITLDVYYFKPFRGPTNKQDVEAVEYAFDFVNGWFLEPLAKGTWPENMLNFATTPTAKYPNGRTLPKFSDEQQQKLIDSYDFLGVNYYTAGFAQYQEPSSDVPLGYTTDSHFKQSVKDPNGIPIGEQAFPTSWICLCPNELTKLLYQVKKAYSVTKPFIITENGFPELNDFGKTYEQVRDDARRITYIKEHLTAIRTARRSKVNITGYFVWSFMDSFEWSSGYKNRFGLIYVDYNNNLQRYPKSSAIWFKKFLSEKKLLKRPITNGDEEDDEVYDTMTEADETTDQGFAKRKKAKA